MTAAGAQRCPFRELSLRVGPRPPFLFPPHRSPCIAHKSAHADSLLSGLDDTQHPVSSCARLPQTRQSSQKRRDEAQGQSVSATPPSRPLPPLRSTKNPYGRQPVRLLDRLSIVLRGRGCGVPVIKADALSRWGRGWGRGSPANRQLKDSDDGGGGFLLSLLLTFSMLNAAVKNFQKDS